MHERSTDPVPIQYLINYTPVVYLLPARNQRPPFPFLPEFSRVAFCRRERSHSTAKLTLVTDFTFHRVLSLSLSLSNDGHSRLITVYIERAKREGHFPLTILDSPPSNACVVVNSDDQHACNTSVKLVDTRITDRTLHSDGNREKLPSRVLLAGI